MYDIFFLLFLLCRHLWGKGSFVIKPILCSVSISSKHFHYISHILVLFALVSVWTILLCRYIISKGHSTWEWYLCTNYMLGQVFPTCCVHFPLLVDAHVAYFPRPKLQYTYFTRWITWKFSVGKFQFWVSDGAFQWKVHHSESRNVQGFPTNRWNTQKKIKKKWMDGTVKGYKKKRQNGWSRLLDGLLSKLRIVED